MSDPKVFKQERDIKQEQATPLKESSVSDMDASSTHVKSEVDIKGNENKPPKLDSSKRVRPDVQEKIMAFWGQELESDRVGLSKKEVAEGCGYASPGVKSFFYAWQDLEREKKWIAKTSSNNYYLTESGKKHIPKGIVLVSKTKDNGSKQASFLKILLKQCKEAKPDKCEIIFRILSDGKWHTLDEFTSATGYANLKTKQLGSPFSHMQKKMNILEKNSNKEYRFTDKCFPEGRP